MVEPEIAVPGAGNVPAAFKTAFSTGADLSSGRYGYTVEAQLPTRAFTLLGKFYEGEDLRFYFAGQLFSNFNDTSGLASTAAGSSVDGSSTVIFGLRDGVPTIAPQRPIRSLGGFVNLGLPLSRWAGADMKSRNAGWTAYFHYGYDYAFARDVRRISGGRSKGDVGAFTMEYKLNSLVGFIYEESMYRTRAANHSAGDVGGLPTFRGVTASEWHDLRSELAVVFGF